MTKVASTRNKIIFFLFFDLCIFVIPVLGDAVIYQVYCVAVVS